MNMQGLKGLCFGQEELPKEVLDWIAQQNLWNLWVPRCYGGLELSLTEGLEKLKELARIDGSLGWTVTLCSGANFFIGNLQKEVAAEIFMNGKKPIFGGSGGVFGTADRQGNGYVVSGKWKYATGARYLTHFTLNAKIREEGREVLTDDGVPLVRSFVLERDDVEICRDWDTMGLRATTTESFTVESQWVDGRYTFLYDELHQPHLIFKVPFSAFADLTLWVNYIGMAQHFLEEAQNIVGPEPTLNKLLSITASAAQLANELAQRVEQLVHSGKQLPEEMELEIHQEASESVRLLSGAMIGAYPLLGIRASSMQNPLNQIFRDYFTATQHHIFSAGGKRS